MIGKKSSLLEEDLGLLYCGSLTRFCGNTALSVESLILAQQTQKKFGFSFFKEHWNNVVARDCH